MEFWAFLFFSFKSNPFLPKITKKNSAIARFQCCGNNTEKTINFWLNLMVYTHVRVRHNVLSHIIYFEDWVNLCLKTMGIDVGEGGSAKETILSSPFTPYLIFSKMKLKDNITFTFVKYFHLKKA